MAESTSRKLAAEILFQDAERIKQLISNQKNHLCIAQCKAFEEVVDTQMYGYSRELAFAVRLGLITGEESQHLLVDLERTLNDLYNTVYEEQKDKLE